MLSFQIVLRTKNVQHKILNIYLCITLCLTNNGRNCDVIKSKIATKLMDSVTVFLAYFAANELRELFLVPYGAVKSTEVETKKKCTRFQKGLRA